MTLDNGHQQGITCLNCGTKFAGEFCNGCGQEAHIHSTIGAFWHDFVHGVLHFEGRSWSTLLLLAWKPGELTRRYIDGERKRFISPVALFLFSIFLMFAVFQVSGISSPADIGAPGRATATPQTEAGTADAFIIGSESQGTALKVQKTGWAWLDTGLEKWRDNPSLMLYKFQANSYKFSWLLILLSIPFVSLLFAGDRRFNSYNHAVFVTYSISFMTILMVLLSLLYKVGLAGSAVAFAAVVIPPIHLYRDLRSTYSLSITAALWRLFALLLFIAIIIALFLQMLWLIGSAG